MIRASKELNAKKHSKFRLEQRQGLADKEPRKETSNLMMLDSPETKKRKSMDIPCPLLPGVPAIPPLRKPQPWQVTRSQETTAAPILVAESGDTFVPITDMEEKLPKSDGVIVINSTPSKKAQKSPKTNANVRKRKLQISSPATKPPVNPVWADIKLIVFEPESSTSSMVPGSGKIILSREIGEFDDDSQRKIADAHDSASDTERDNTDMSSRPRDVFEYAAEINDIEDPILAKEIESIGAEADVALRAIAGPDNNDLLNFDWCGDITKFEGVRERFTGPSGPTFDVTGLTPLEVLKKIWDDDIIDHIVRETNRYAHQTRAKTTLKSNSRMGRWVDTTKGEIWKFLTIFMLQSLVMNNVEREYWFPSNEQLRIGAFNKIMSFNRFLLLKRCLHFVDNTLLLKKNSKIDKVLPIVDHLNKKFSTLYLLGQNVAIDESLLLWKGRLSFVQSIVEKKSKVGIKSYELCESRTGYLWKTDLYTGKGHVRATQGATEEHEPDNTTSQIVYSLMRPLFGKGHTVVMDNFYNSPLLSRLLKSKHNTDTMGTLRLCREFVPETLKLKNKTNMRPGEVTCSVTKDLSLVVWRDKTVVALISTFHPPEVGGKEKYGYYKYKPQVVLDYNLSMGGVDRKDQMLHAYPLERTRNYTWYKKFFRRLLNVSIHNAFVIYNHDRTQKTQIGNREFRQELVQQLLQMYSPQALIPEKSPPQTILPQFHLPAKNQKPQRCKLCRENKVRRKTVWRCSTCKTNLCIERCYTEYHVKHVK